MDNIVKNLAKWQLHKVHKVLNPK